MRPHSMPLLLGLLLLCACAERPADHDAAEQQQPNPDNTRYELREVEEVVPAKPAITKPTSPHTSGAPKVETTALQPVSQAALAKQRRPADALAADIAAPAESANVAGLQHAGYRAYPHPPLPAPVASGERYDGVTPSDTKLVTAHPLSTFSLDVDTGSYTNARRFLNHNQLPPPDAVRLEEWVNYFAYDYAAPRAPEQPFSVLHDLAPAPWNNLKVLMRIGLRAYAPDPAARPAANLVFLVDTSGSMSSPNKLPLLTRALQNLSRRLGPQDRVAIVAYAGSAGLVLDATPGNQYRQISDALQRLRAGGSTNGGAGLQLAYDTARAHFIEDGINRVFIATDGDFNVGPNSAEALLDMVGQGRADGIALDTLGFGQGNYHEALVEQIANKGDGRYLYIDNLAEAERALGEQLTGTLFTVARDAKVQVEFNPSRVHSYRLLGYENRALQDRDFNDDAVDAGDVGAGHTVTALYELTLTGSAPGVDPLRYAQEPAKPAAGTHDNELALIKLRYKTPGATGSLREEHPVYDKALGALEPSGDFAFAVSVAAAAQLLRGDNLGAFSLSDVERLAQQSAGQDPARIEFTRLLANARLLQGH